MDTEAVTNEARTANLLKIFIKSILLEKVRNYTLLGREAQYITLSAGINRD